MKIINSDPPSERVNADESFGGLFRVLVVDHKRVLGVPALLQKAQSADEQKHGGHDQQEIQDCCNKSPNYDTEQQQKQRSRSRNIHACNRINLLNIGQTHKFRYISHSTFDWIGVAQGGWVLGIYQDCCLSAVAPHELRSFLGPHRRRPR